MKGYNYLPFITFGGFSTTNSNSTIASARRDALRLRNRLQPALHERLLHSHRRLAVERALVAGGYELRRQRWNINQRRLRAGRYFFNGAYTRLNNSAPLNDQAQEWPSSPRPADRADRNGASSGRHASQFEIARTATGARSRTPSSSRTMALQLEADRQRRNCAWSCCRRCPSAERGAGGSDPTISSPIETAALANYAKNPIAEIPVSAFASRRPEVRRRRQSTTTYPSSCRAPRLVPSSDRRRSSRRMGTVRYDYYFDAGNQTGFSQPTPILTPTTTARLPHRPDHRFQRDAGQPVAVRSAPPPASV